MNLASALQQGLRALALDLSKETQTRVLTYLQLLTKWNAVYNLTAVRNPTDMLSKHVFDSLSVIPYIHGDRILDVGTGAGLPGLLLALACPQWQCVLLDSSAKKSRFVHQALLELNIPNAKAVCHRVETFKAAEQGGFSTIIARAYSSLRDFYTATQHLGMIDTHWLAMKGLYPQDEVSNLQDLPVKVETILLHVPYLQAERHLVVMKVGKLSL